MLSLTEAKDLVACLERSLSTMSGLSRYFDCTGKKCKYYKRCSALIKELRR